jgi:O-antigen/teichoic acid export membrane protein
VKPNLTQRFAGSVASQVVGRAAVVVLGLFTIALVTRYLGLAGYGQYATAFALVNLVGLALDLGLYLVIVRVISTHERRPEAVVSAVLGLRLVLFAAAFLLIAAATLVLPYDGATKTAILIGALSLLGISLNQVLGGIFQAHLRMDLFVIGDVVGRLATLALAWLLLEQGQGLLGVVWAVVTGYGLNLALTYYLARPRLEFGISFDLSAWRWILKQGIPLGVLIVLQALYLRADVFLLSLFRPAAEVGEYGVAAKVAEVLTGFGAILMVATLPLISAALAERSPGKVNRISTEAYDLLLASGVGIVVGALFLAGPAVELVAGPEFAGATLPLQILAFAVAFGFMTGFYGQLMLAWKRQARLVRPTLYAVSAGLALALVLIDRFGAVGAAAGLLATELALLTLYVRAARPVTGFRPPEGRLFRLFIAALALAVTLWALRGLPVLVSATLGSVVYAAALSGLGLIRRERLRSLRGRVGK